MKILWICASAVPEASELFQIPKTPYGGWLDGMSSNLIKLAEVSLTILFQGNTDVVKKKKGKFIDYYMLPVQKKNTFEQTIDYVLKEINADIIHLHGIENPMALSVVRVVKDFPIVASIQGIKKIYSFHYRAQLPEFTCHTMGLSNFIFKTGTIARQQKKFFKDGDSEVELLNQLKYVIGRTTWDKACTLMMSDTFTYYTNNEILRGSFYRNQWNYKECKKHTIFISQGTYPLKGLHMALQAVCLLKVKFPDIKLVVAGANVVNDKSLKGRLKQTSYGKYINKLINKMDLNNSIEFTGPLDETQMCNKVKECNVFVVSSSIENSPNSLGEAMIMGVPCVASAVGGMADLLLDKVEGFLYPFDEYYMMAYYIEQLFIDVDMAVHMGKKAREHALRTHDMHKNSETLLHIYKEIIEKSGI